MIEVLVDRANTVDPISQEYHPNRETILKELQLAQDFIRVIKIFLKRLFN